MARNAVVNVGVIGLGFIGRIHVNAYQAAEADGACRLTAVCDSDPARRAGGATTGGNLETNAVAARLFDERAVRACISAEEVLADPDVHAVSICTHTDTHVDLAIRALQAGKHVLVEKPVAIRSRDVQRLIEARDALRLQRGAAPLCMPAMCMRFWPGWSWLKACIAERRFGAVRSAVFQRLASMPAWSPFYADRARSGGALFDLHIHDADFVRWCFGEPDSLVSAGTIDHVSTLYCFTGGPPHVLAEGGWDHAPGFPFRMRYVVVFEQATADFDLSREQPLMLSREGRSEAVALESASGYEQQVRAFVAAVAAGATDGPVTLADALSVTKLLELEAKSIGGA